MNKESFDFTCKGLSIFDEFATEEILDNYRNAQYDFYCEQWKKKNLIVRFEVVNSEGAQKAFFYGLYLKDPESLFNDIANRCDVKSGIDYGYNNTDKYKEFTIVAYGQTTTTRITINEFTWIQTRYISKNSKYISLEELFEDNRNEDPTV